MGPRVLVVDDDDALCRAYRRLLSRRCDVTAIASAQQALDSLEGDSHYDVVLIDLQMPEMSGVALYRALEGHHPELLSRVAFVTGGATSRDSETFVAAHRTRVLYKPFEPDELSSLIDRVLSEQP